MNSFSKLVPAKRGARPMSAALLAYAASAVTLAQPAMAQRADPSVPGPYAVARAGVQVDADVKARAQARAKNAPAVPSTIPLLPKQSIDADAGFTGELGVGYDFGGLRLEGTAGYDTAQINAKGLSDKNFVGSGRVKSFDLGVTGYVDLIKDGPFKPFVGAGIGASRVSYDVGRISSDKTPGTLKPSVGMTGKDWGLRWHLDAGASYDVTPTTAIELLGRYSQTSGLKINGVANDAVPNRLVTEYKPKASATSIMVGIRQKF